MVRLAIGPPSVDKLHSGIENIPKKTKNLGELFNEAKKNQPFKKIRHRSKNAHKIFVLGMFFLKENNKQSSVQRKTLRELYDAIIEKQLPLDIIDGKTFRTFIDANCNDDDYKYLIGKIWG